MKAHPFADIFPLLEGEALAALVASVTDRGLLHPIVLFEESKSLTAAIAGTPARRPEWSRDSASSIQPLTETRWNLSS